MSEMSDVHSSSYTQAIHEIEYDLKLNVVIGEKLTENRDEKSKALKLWLQNVVDEYAHFPPCVSNDYFGYIKQKKWFKKIESKIPDFINANQLNYSEGEDSLKVLIPRIGNQILKLFSIFYQIKIEMTTKMLELYTRRALFTEHFTIDYTKTALAIMEGGCLDVRNMFAICCYFCLEDRIKDMLTELPKELIDKFANEFDDYEISQLMALWKYHGLKEKKKFDHMIGNLKRKQFTSATETKGEFLLFWAIKRGNEVAIQYLWENLCDEETKENPQKFATRALYYNNINIVCYLASQITRQDQIERFYVNDGYVLLSMLASDSRWNDYFMPTSEYLLQFTSKMTFINTLRTLIQCWLVNKSNRKNYVEHFDAFIAKFNVNMNKSILDSTTSILNVIYELEEGDVINALLNVRNDDDIKTIFNNDQINELGKELILNRKTRLFEKFIKEIFNEQEMEIFKTRFFENNNFEIGLQCFEDIKYEALSEFVFTFCPETSLDNFKKTILFERKGEIIGRALLIGDESRISMREKVDKILNWCYNGNEILISDCKKKLFGPDEDSYSYAKEQFLTVVQTFIDKDRWNKVLNILEWAFQKDKTLEYKTIALTTEIAKDKEWNTKM